MTSSFWFIASFILGFFEILGAIFIATSCIRNRKLYKQYIKDIYDITYNLSVTSEGSELYYRYVSMRIWNCKKRDLYSILRYAQDIFNKIQKN